MTIKNKFISLVACVLVLITVGSATISAAAMDGLGLTGFSLPVASESVNEPEKFPTPARKAIKNKEGFTFTADNVKIETAELNWSSKELVLSYTLCKYNPINHMWEEYLTTTENTVPLDKLEEDTDYRFAVFNSVSAEPLGEVSFTTGVKTASVAVKHYSSDSVELRIRHTNSVSHVILYRSTDKKDFKKIAEIDEETYLDTDVEEETTYYYRVSCVIRRGHKVNESATSRIVDATTLKGFALPEIAGTTKTYAFYTAVTATGTPQYKLLNSDECYTDDETGIRMVDGFYCIALGSFYGTRIGTRYRITLQDGDELKELNCILCDQKANVHTDEKHQYAVQNKDIMEFYIEKSKLPRGIAGDYGHLEQFRGEVVKIEQYPDIEENDETAKN